MVGSTVSSMETVLEQVLLHPLLLVIVKVSVKESLVQSPASTVTDWLVVEPLIVPFPAMLQL